MAITAADKLLLVAIIDEPDRRTKLSLIKNYWRDDADRMERTEREWMLLHLGMLTGIAEKAYEALDRVVARN